LVIDEVVKNNKKEIHHGEHGKHGVLICAPLQWRGQGWVKTIKKLCSYAVLRFCSYVIPQAPLLGGAGGG